MARYTCSYLAKVSLERLQPSLIEVLQACDLEIVYQVGDYLMAQETPGSVNFSRLVTVEVLIDTTTAKSSEVQVNFVVKNEELPLQLNNHCRQIFNLLQEKVAEDQQWQIAAN